MALLLLTTTGTGCVTVYQPLTSLQRPVVVDPRLPNFQGTRLVVRCIPTDDFPAGDAEALCRRLGTLFRNQGAEVETDVPRDGRSSRFDENEQKPDLIVDVRSRTLHREHSTLLNMISGFTFTIVPAWEEMSFAQDVTIRDASGSLLASDTLQARFIEYVGVGVWSVNWILDVLVRPEEDKLTGDVAQREFSRDFYGQLSQLAFNARVRAQVLRGFDTASASPAPETPPQN